MTSKPFPKKESDEALAYYGTGISTRGLTGRKLSVLGILGCALRHLRYSQPMIPVSSALANRVDDDVSAVLRGQTFDGLWSSRWDSFFSDGIVWDASSSYRGPTCGLPIMRFIGLIHEQVKETRCRVDQLRPDLALMLAVELQPKKGAILRYEDGKRFIRNAKGTYYKCNVMVPNYSDADYDVVTALGHLMCWSEHNPYVWPEESLVRTRRRRS